MPNPRGIPAIFHRRGRKKQAPPPSRDAHIYRDLRDEAVNVDVGAMEVIVDPGVDGQLGTPDDKVKVAPKKKAAPKKAASKVVKPEMSLDNTKAELMKAAKKLKLKLPGSATKAEILAAIDEA